MRIALIRLSALGDILRVLPAWENLHAAFPMAQFKAVIEDRHAFLLEPMPWLEPILVRRRSLGQLWTAFDEMKRVASLIQDCDVSLDFHGILKSAIAPWLANIPERWGDGITREWAHLLQTHPLSFCLMSRYDQALRLAGDFGLSRGLESDTLRLFHPIFKELVLPDHGFTVWAPDNNLRIVLVPGTSNRGAIKRWPLKHWIALATKLLKKNFQIRWSLGPEEANLREWLPNVTEVDALPSTSFWNLASILRQSDVVITSDTGLLHLSILLGVQVIALYGSSDPLISGIPYGTGHILRTGIKCSPCRNRLCQRLQCLEDLRVESVFAKLSSIVDMKLQ
jgi:ADP-heptose:LPS heptosyltransferase